MKLDALPQPDAWDGSPRKVGVEVELGGLEEARVARILANTLGGTARQTATFEWCVEGSGIGDIEVLLDTALRDRVESRVAKAGLRLGRAVIPVEFVTEPILPEMIAEVDRACAALAEAGALGTADGILLGFGLHLNVALRSMEVADILPTLTGFALIEDWMRDRMRLNAARRIQPFVDTYPSDLVDRLCDPAERWTLDRLTQVYLDLAPNRNHALDLLPILKHHDPAAVVAAVPQMDHKAGRPAWHYRLPDSRIDEPGWSVALEWNRWCKVERVGADDALLERLKALWRGYRGDPLMLPGRWRAVSADILDKELELP